MGLVRSVILAVSEMSETIGVIAGLEALGNHRTDDIAAATDTDSDLAERGRALASARDQLLASLYDALEEDDDPDA